MIIPQNIYIYISIFIILLYILFIIIGYKKGFLYELVSLIYTGVSIFIAWLISPTLASLYPIIDLKELSDKADLLDKLININPIINTVAYFLIVFLILKLFYFVLTFILKGINKIPVLGKFNQILGLIAGIFNATIITLALSMLLTLPIFKNGKEVKENTLFMFIDKASSHTMNFLIDNVDLNTIKDKFANFKIETVKEDIQDLLDFTKNE